MEFDTILSIIITFGGIIFNFVYQAIKIGNKFNKLELKFMELDDAIKELKVNNKHNEDTIYYLKMESEISKKEFQFIKENILDIKSTLKEVIKELKENKN